MRVNTRSLPRDEIRSLLEQVVGWLESGTITDVSDTEVYQRIIDNEIFEEEENRRGFFNMHAMEEQYKCGTVACIGGWMDFAARERGHLTEIPLDFDEARSLNRKERKGLYNLFMSWSDGSDETRNRTREEAVVAAKVWLEGTYEYNPWFPDQTDPYPDED